MLDGSLLSRCFCLQSSYWGDHNWEEGKQRSVDTLPKLIAEIPTDDDNDLTARKAFESLLRISLLQPTSPKFHNFSEIVRKVAAEVSIRQVKIMNKLSIGLFISQRYNYNFFEGEEVSEIDRTRKA